MIPARYFIMRVTRYGPLVPARLMEIDTEPGEPDNPRDRWPATILCADIAGEVVPPEQLTDRFFWQPPHWKHVKEISQREYEHLFALMRRAETDDPTAPVLRPRQRVRAADVTLPSFAEENAR